MEDKYIIRDEDQAALENSRRELIKTVRNSPKGNDPRVIEILAQLEKVYLVEKYYELVAKLIPILFEDVD